MKVHHLNCGTMTPIGGDLVAHCLLAETADGLALVDTGFGLEDIANPRRLGGTRRIIRPRLDPEETALRQVEALGHKGSDVRHIFVTHFDLDHIGGLADFPHARVHVTAAEAKGAVHAPTAREKLRFRPAQWAHGVKLVEHSPDGEPWRGFAAAEEVLPGLVMLALPGHTRGHAAYAVDSGDRWVLHAGDAFYDRATLTRGKGPWTLRYMESSVAFDLKQVRANHERLAELHDRHEPDLLIVSAHDPTLLADALAS